MILLDMPYVSDFLIDTIKKNGFKVIDTVQSRQLYNGETLNIISEKDAISEFEGEQLPLLYTNSENSIAWIENNLSFTSIPEKISAFKDKAFFRELTKDRFTSLFFKKVKLEDIRYLDVSGFPFPFVIKPSVGFFSLGVYQVENLQDWEDTVTTIYDDIEKYRDLYPVQVLSTTSFLIEGFIKGDEFAVDCYYDEKGEPVVLNIFEHLFSDGKDVSDRVYLVSKMIIEKHISKVEEFLRYIGSKTNLKRFPLHVEIRIDDNGEIVPVEINPLRFGGWCTTADFTYYSNGYNTYEYYFNQLKPNWDEVLKRMGDKVYSMSVLNNSTGVEGKDISSFDYEKLFSKFKSPILIRKADFKNFPLFGFLFLETRPEDQHEINFILKTDLREFIRT